MESDRGNPKQSKTNTSPCYTVQHKSQMDWRGIETEPLQWEAKQGNGLCSSVFKLDKVIISDTKWQEGYKAGKPVCEHSLTSDLRSVTKVCCRTVVLWGNTVQSDQWIPSPGGWHYFLLRTCSSLRHTTF